MKILVTSILDLKRVGHNRIHSLLKHLSSSHQITALCLNAWWLEKQIIADSSLPPHLDPYLQQVFDGIQIIYLAKGRIQPVLQEIWSPVNLPRLLQKIDYANFDLHINYSSLATGFVATAMLKSRGIPTVFDIADDLPAAFRISPQIPSSLRHLSGFVSDKLLQANVKLAATITCISRALQSKYNLPVDKTVHLPNGFDESLFIEHLSEKMREKIQIDSSDFVVGFVGTLGQERVDFEPVFLAVKGLVHSAPRTRLLIVGDGGGLERNRDMASKYGIADRVLFTGYVAHEQIPEYISCMDVCIIPFTDESLTNQALPLKLCEYMACGRPVISKPSTGVIEAVGDRVLYAANEKEWAEKILDLYKDPLLRVKLGTAGKDFVAGNYSWSKICQKFETVLLEAA